MPLIRLARDKRGIDTLYLLHHGSDGRGETRLRVIYFYAGPQGLLFGRRALDPLTQRALEQRYPDVVFDWPALLQEIEQRRLPPQVEPQARRMRPAPQAERRPATSESAVDRSSAARRKRRRGDHGQPVSAPPGVGGASPAAPFAAAPPIIE